MKEKKITMAFLRMMAEKERLAGNIQSALEYADAQTRLYPTFVVSKLDKAVLHLMLDQDKEAIDECEKVLMICSDSPTAHNVKAAALVSLKRYEEAEEEFDKAISCDPENTEAIEGKRSIEELKAL